MSGTSSRIALASSGVSVIMPCAPVRTPFTLREPASTQTRLSPSAWSSASARAGAASPIAETHTTTATPSVTLNAVRTLRPLLRRSARMASTTEQAGDDVGRRRGEASRRGHGRSRTRRHVVEPLPLPPLAAG